jgi:hypothetical protein
VNCNCGLPEGWSRDRVDQHIKSLIKKVTKDKVKDEMTSPTEETKVVMKWWGSICTCDPKTLEDPPGNSPSGIRYLGRSYQILLLILAHYTHVRVTSYICFCAGEEDDEQEEKKSKRKAKILDDPSGNSPSGIRYLRRSYQILLLILAHYTHVRVTSYICFCAVEEDNEQQEEKQEEETESTTKSRKAKGGNKANKKQK